MGVDIHTHLEVYDRNKQLWKNVELYIKTDEGFEIIPVYEERFSLFFNTLQQEGYPISEILDTLSPEVLEAYNTVHEEVGYYDFQYMTLGDLYSLKHQLEFDLEEMKENNNTEYYELEDIRDIIKTLNTMIEDIRFRVASAGYPVNVMHERVRLIFWFDH